jgi:GDP-L-fucose synthase
VETLTFRNSYRRPHTPEVVVWGSGTPRREFLQSDDLAQACLKLMTLDDTAVDTLTRDPEYPPLINIGYGEDLTIAELARLIAELSGYEGKIVFDTTKPDGTPRKLMDSSRMRALRWSPRVSLRDGLRAIIDSVAKQRQISTMSA